MIEWTESGFIAEVTISSDEKGTMTKFISDHKGSVFEATEDAAIKAVDCCTSKYKLNIVDYTYKVFQKMAVQVYELGDEERAAS